MLSHQWEVQLIPGGKNQRNQFLRVMYLSSLISEAHLLEAGSLSREKLHLLMISTVAWAALLPYVAELVSSLVLPECHLTRAGNIASPAGHVC